VTGTELDADGLPLLPALPGGRPLATAAKSLARLVMSVRTGVLTVRTSDLTAMVVFLDREPIDGVAVQGERRLTGPDVLDEIADVPVEDMSLTEVEPALARVLGSYFLPTTLRAVPAAVVVAEDFVRSLARPGQRGCVAVRAAAGLGLVFVASGRVLLAYSASGEATGGFEQVAPLLADPEATLWAKLGPELAGVDMALEAAETRVAPAPPVEQEPAAPPPVLTGYFPHEGGGKQDEPPDGELIDAVLAEVRQALGPHAVRVERIFERAEPTAAGLRAAAESLPEQRIRLIGRAALETAASRALAVLDRR
jgi:hypothetical protein